MTTVPQSNPSPVARTLRALSHRNFRLFLIGQLISLIGSWMQSLAQGWLVWRLSNSYFQLGLINFCQFSPVLVLGLVGGVTADRFRRHRIVIVTQTLMLLQATVLAALSLTGVIQVWHVMLLALALGACNAFDMPGRQSLLVQLVSRDDLPNAIALNSSVFNGARIVGPALAGLVVARWGEGMCFLLNAISYLAVLAGLLAMRVDATRPARPPGNAWHGVREGLAYAWRARHVRALLTLMVITGLFGVSYTSFLPAFADDVLHVGASGLGVLMSCMGAGALFGALTMAYRTGTEGLGRYAALAACGFGATLVAFSLAGHVAAAGILIALVAGCMMTQLAATNTLLQSLVPDRLRGRLMSLYTVTFIGMAPLGSLVMGRLAALLGLRVVLGAGGAVVLVAGLAFARILPRVVAQASEPVPATV